MGLITEDQSSHSKAKGRKYPVNILKLNNPIFGNISYVAGAVLQIVIISVKKVLSSSPKYLLSVVRYHRNW